MNVPFTFVINNQFPSYRAEGTITSREQGDGAWNLVCATYLVVLHVIEQSHVAALSI
jgi:hypothetical protein